ncbi:hypothetical protein HKX48_004870 [Thoreauomyces humboldtii]|nr:hypothetical protein HKX48_004870 [Thoreauomyces humboldtii]
MDPVTAATEDPWEEDEVLDWDWDWSDPQLLASQPLVPDKEPQDANVPNSTSTYLGTDRIKTLAEIAAEESMKSRLLINPNKPGTQYIDKSVVQHIIYEASKGSPFFLAEQRRDAIATKRADALKARVEEFSTMNLRAEQSLVDREVSVIQAEWDATEPRCIACVDMDAFYASVEELDKPELKDKV